MLSHGQEAIQFAHAAGVEVGFGSDLMGDLETEQMRGIELQVQASDAATTLHSLTEVNARLLREPRAGHSARVRSAMRSCCQPTPSQNRPHSGRSPHEARWCLGAKSLTAANSPHDGN